MELHALELKRLVPNAHDFAQFHIWVDPAMTVTAGYPGLQTDRMQAAFGSFVVLKPN